MIAGAGGILEREGEIGQFLSSKGREAVRTIEKMSSELPSQLCVPEPAVEIG